MALDVTELTEAIVDAMGTEWQNAKGTPLPAAGLEDRRILFAAVARGLLTYLEVKQERALKKLDLEDSGGDVRSYTVRATDFDITGT
jgi:hypothetical protein